MNEIKLANLGKRFLASLLDLLIALFIGFGVFAIVQNITLKNQKAVELKDEISLIQVDSHLYFEDTDGSISYHQYDSYEPYLNDIVFYYTEYSKKYDYYGFNVMVLGLDDPKNLYGDQLSSRDSYIVSKGPSYFAQPESLNELAEVKAECYVDGDKTKGLTEEAKGNLLSFFFSETTLSVYYLTLQDFVGTEPLASLIENYYLYSKGIALYISFGFTFIVCYLAIPLLFKNGETLAKKLMKICLVRGDGFSIKKTQLVLRSLPILLFIGISYFFFWEVYGLLLTFGALIISYILTLANPLHKSIHDFIAYTLVVDSTNSLFFKNEEEKQTFESSMNKLNKPE